MFRYPEELILDLDNMLILAHQQMFRMLILLEQRTPIQEKRLYHASLVFPVFPAVQKRFGGWPCYSLTSRYSTRRSD